MSHFIPLSHGEWLEMQFNVRTTGRSRVSIPGHPHERMSLSGDFPNKCVVVYDDVDGEAAKIAADVQGEK